MEREINMKLHDKAFLISGMMFNAVFFLLMLAEVVITKSAGYALFAAIATYIFSNMYITHKRLKVAATTNSQTLNKIFILII